MFATDLPFREYFDLSGKPLDDGYIYFGQPNQNPETAPVTVYWDAAGTQPALQPIRTTNGLVIHNGAIANLFAVANYSMTVRERNGALVFYAPTADRVSLAAVLADSANAANGAAMIGFDGTTLDQFFKSRSNRVVDSIAALKALDKTKYTRAFVTQYYGVMGATAPDGGGGAYFYDSTDTTSADNGGTIIVAADGARWKLNVAGPINIRQFGAKGDGITDDTAAIQAAIDSGAKFIYRPSGTYKITSPILLAGDGVTIFGPGVVNVAAADVYAYKITGNNNTISRGGITNTGGFGVSNTAAFPLSAGVFISGNGNTVENMQIEGLINGILISGPNPNQCNGNRVLNNRISVLPFNYGASIGWPNDGILSFYALGTVIEGNTVAVYTAPGAFVLTGTTYTYARGAIICDISSENNLISTNDCGEGFLATIHNEAGINNVIFNNKAYKGSLSTIVGGSGRVEKNQVFGPAQNGSAILNACITVVPGGLVQDNIITGNSASVPGVQFQSNGANYRVIGNTFAGSFNHGVFGLHLSDVWIKDNAFGGAYTDLISLGTVAPETGRALIQGNSAGGTYTNAVVGSPLLNCVISGNEFQNSTGDTITIGSDSNNIIISGNDLSTASAATYAVHLGFNGTNRWACITGNNMNGHTTAVGVVFSDFVAHQIVASNINNTTVAL